MGAGESSTAGDGSPARPRGSGGAPTQMKRSNSELVFEHLTRKHSQGKMCRTVDVPKDLQEQISVAEWEMNHFFFSLKEKAKGVTEQGGARYLFFRAAAFSSDFMLNSKEVFGFPGEVEAQKFAIDILSDFSRYLGTADAVSYMLRSKEEVEMMTMFGVGAVYLSYTGWGFCKMEECRPRARGLYLQMSVPSSFECASWMEAGRMSKSPVCIMLAGYVAGWCEKVFHQRLVCVEVSCQACGDDDCRFIVSSGEDIALRAREYLASTGCLHRLEDLHLPKETLASLSGSRLRHSAVDSPVFAPPQAKRGSQKSIGRLVDTFNRKRQRTFAIKRAAVEVCREQGSSTFDFSAPVVSSRAVKRRHQQADDVDVYAKSDEKLLTSRGPGEKDPVEERLADFRHLAVDERPIDFWEFLKHPMGAPMADRLEAYYSAKGVDPTSGHLLMEDERYIMVRGPSISAEFNTIAMTFGKSETVAEEFSRNFLFDLGILVGRSDCAFFKRKMATRGVEDHFLGFSTHCENAGWGKIEFDEEWTEGMYNKTCVIVFDSSNNFEAAAWVQKAHAERKRAKCSKDDGSSGAESDEIAVGGAFSSAHSGGESGPEGGEEDSGVASADEAYPHPMCVMMAGYASGWFSESFGVLLSAVELSCMSCGQECCQWLVASPELIQDRVSEWFAREKEETPDQVDALDAQHKAMLYPEHGKSKAGSTARVDWLSNVVKLNNIFENYESADHLAFCHFLESEFCSENMDCFKAIRKHKTSPDRSHKEPPAQWIYDTFVSRDAERMVNLPDAMVRKIEADLLLNPIPANIFDKAEVECQTMMKFGAFERFVAANVDMSPFLDGGKSKGRRRRRSSSAGLPMTSSPLAGPPS